METGSDCMGKSDKSEMRGEKTALKVQCRRKVRI